MKYKVNKKEVYNGLEVVEEIEPNITPNGTKFRKVKCICIYCGKTSIYDLIPLIKGKRQCSCQGLQNIEDDKIDKKIRNAYGHLKNRCYNPKDHRYKNYGAKGVTVCDEWLNNYNSFKEWSLNNGFSMKLTIDRIDSNGNYEPNNCRWVTQKVQQNNRTNNTRYSFFGMNKTLAEWSEWGNIEKSKLLYRIRHNWPENKLFV